MRAAGFLAAAAAATAVAQPTSMPSCVFQLPTAGVTYDLSGLQGQLQRIDDNRNDTTSTWYDYWFGVCQDLDDSFFALAPQCWTTNGDDGNTTTTGYGSAFQVGKAANVKGFCKRVGGPAMNGLFFPMGDPRRYRQGLAQGITLFYPGGDTCPDPYNSSNFIPRSLAVDFMCYDSNGFVPQYDTILEDVRCVYHAMIKSRVGCPLECKRGGPTNRVCAANGICGYDMTNGYAKCFCNKGYSGPDCTALGDKGLPAPPDYSPNIAGGFFGGLFGGVAVAAAFFVARSKLSGGGFFDNFSFGGGGGGRSSYRAGGGASSSSSSSSSGGYVPAPTSAFTGTSSSAAAFGGMSTNSGYVAPDASGGAGGFGDVYGQLSGAGGNDGPLIG